MQKKLFLIIVVTCFCSETHAVYDLISRAPSLMAGLVHTITQGITYRLWPISKTDFETKCTQFAQKLEKEFNTRNETHQQELQKLNKLFSSLEETLNAFKITLPKQCYKPRLMLGSFSLQLGLLAQERDVNMQTCNNRLQDLGTRSRELEDASLQLHKEFNAVTQQFASSEQFVRTISEQHEQLAEEHAHFRGLCNGLTTKSNENGVLLEQKTQQFENAAQLLCGLVNQSEEKRQEDKKRLRTKRKEELRKLNEELIALNREIEAIMQLAGIKPVQQDDPSLHKQPTPVLQ